MPQLYGEGVIREELQASESRLDICDVMFVLLPELCG